MMTMKILQLRHCWGTKFLWNFILISFYYCFIFSALHAFYYLFSCPPTPSLYATIPHVYPDSPFPFFLLLLLIKYNCFYYFHFIIIIWVFLFLNAWRLWERNLDMSLNKINLKNWNSLQQHTGNKWTPIFNLYRNSST